MAKKNENVRFVRIRGKIVPIRSKRTKAEQNLDSRKRLLAKRVNQGGAIGALSGLGAGAAFMTEAKVVKRPMYRTKKFKMVDGNMSFKVARGFRPGLSFRKANIVSTGVVSLYGALAGSLAGNLAGAIGGKIEGAIRHPRQKAGRKGRK